MAEALATADMNVMLNGFIDPSEIEAIRGRLAETYHTDIARSDQIADTAKARGIPEREVVRDMMPGGAAHEGIRHNQATRRAGHVPLFRRGIVGEFNASGLAGKLGLRAKN